LNELAKANRKAFLKPLLGQTEKRRLLEKTKVLASCVKYFAPEVAELEKMSKYPYG